MFDEANERLISKHGSSGLLVDTNLLLLLIIGNYRVDRIRTFKRTMKYERRDYNLLRLVMKRFRSVFTTPNIMTETDNLGRQLESREHAAFSLEFSKFARVAVEISQASASIVGNRDYPRLGLADAVSTVAVKSCLLLSDDLTLCLAVQHNRLDAINFNHLRL